MPLLLGMPERYRCPLPNDEQVDCCILLFQWPWPREGSPAWPLLTSMPAPRFDEGWVAVCRISGMLDAEGQDNLVEAPQTWKGPKSTSWHSRAYGSQWGLKVRPDSSMHKVIHGQCSASAWVAAAISNEVDKGIFRWNRGVDCLHRRIVSLFA